MFHKFYLTLSFCRLFKMFNVTWVLCQFWLCWVFTFKIHIYKCKSIMLLLWNWYNADLFPLWKEIFWLELCSSSSSYSSSRSFFTANLISEGIESKWHQHIWIDHLIFSFQQNIYHFIVCIIRWNSMPVNEIITTSRRAATLDMLYWKRLTDFYFVEQTLSR